MLKIHLITSVLCLFAVATAKDAAPITEFVIHATNNSRVPSVSYIVDAVECLKEAYVVYSEPLDMAQLYAELFQERHNETEWNVVVGYTALHISSKWFVETTVLSGGKSKEDKKDKEKNLLYLIFSKL